MKTLKIDFCGFWGSFKMEKNLFVKILSKHFNVEISDNPDFVICSNRGNPFEYMKYDCVRIMLMGENMSPDFTVFDYCIGFDFLEFSDRYFRLPFGFYFDDAKPWIPEKLDIASAKEILEGKKYFCNFIYGHQSSHGMRENLFEALDSYKPVVSPGSYMNNVNNEKKRCSWQEKNEYLKASKFTIAGDSIEYPGFVTEKIVQPFMCHSIPVYFGSTKIDEDFNTNSFVWCKSKDDIERTLEQVKFLDTHDDAYIDMLMCNPLHSEDYLVKKYEQLEAFLLNIFSQERDEAFRRVRYFCAQQHEEHLKEYAERYERMPGFIKKLRTLRG
ncbi:MAG: hypothetical protein J6K64_04930 [Clostridia bacterium]|nr:hypothetical protein [Clostridia bacterium]